MGGSGGSAGVADVGHRRVGTLISALLLSVLWSMHGLAIRLLYCSVGHCKMFTYVQKCT